MVILDEFHYMNDPSRGTVWEECCILSPTPVSLIALSATMSNARQITSWLSRIHGPTALIASEHRPVTLRHHYAETLSLLPLTLTLTLILTLTLGAAALPLR